MVSFPFAIFACLSSNTEAIVGSLTSLFKYFVRNFALNVRRHFTTVRGRQYSVIIL